MVAVVELLILPPVSGILLSAIGYVVRRRRRRLGHALIWLGVISIWLACTPVVGVGLLRSLQPDAALSAATMPPDAGAIVVLSADMDPFAPEFGGQDVGALTLERIRYGAVVHRTTGLPLLVSGGQLAGCDRPHASVMRDVLEREFDVRVKWVEDRSHNTFENARYSAELLADAGIDRVLLVTHAWHMPRAVASFERHDIRTVPAPTAFRAWPSGVFSAVVPRWTALRDTCLALHEILGRAWYAIAY